MTLILFDPIQRTRQGPARRNDAHFDYWNESARPELAPIRTELELWFTRYPVDHAPDLQARFRSSDNLTHLSALFELYVHEQLRAGGCSVSCHPPVPESDKHPDFLASRPEQSPFVVECVLAAENRQKTGRERVQDEALDAVDELSSADFYLHVEVHGTPTGSLPVGRRQLVPKLDAWLQELDADDITRGYETDGSRALPKWTWEGASVRLEFTAVPKKAEARGRSERLIGLESAGISSKYSPDSMIEGAFKKKATRYGRIRMPYLIAINVLEFPVDGDDVDAVLERSWGTTSAPKNRRVSGVLLGTVWNGKSAVVRELQLVPNPAASWPITTGLVPFQEYAGGILEH